MNLKVFSVLISGVLPIRGVFISGVLLIKGVLISGGFSQLEVSLFQGVLPIRGVLISGSSPKSRCPHFRGFSQLEVSTTQLILTVPHAAVCSDLLPPISLGPVQDKYLQEVLLRRDSVAKAQGLMKMFAVSFHNYIEFSFRLPHSPPPPPPPPPPPLPH